MRNKKTGLAKLVTGLFGMVFGSYIAINSWFCSYTPTKIQEARESYRNLEIKSANKNDIGILAGLVLTEAGYFLTLSGVSERYGRRDNEN